MCERVRVWLLAVTFLCTVHVTAAGKGAERSYDPHFFNVGTQSEKPISKQLENAVLKSRVEVQGEVLRHRIQALRGPRGDSRLDLVFLVDASASVGPENFESELRFVRKLLADLEVSSGATRVAVVTFSSPGSVLRHVDTISQSKSQNASTAILRHKCEILERALPAIEYSGGGTYTLGAILEAQKILRAAREGARRAVFLLTDGYSNGGDPREAARVLHEELGAAVFTFGVRSGNTQELLEMASTPAQEHSFLLASFEQFAALARRALHHDLRTGARFEGQDSDGCNSLCSEGRDCCEQDAQCVCNTLTGRSQCLCPAGQYGVGLRGECHACPAGTYAATEPLQRPGASGGETPLYSTRCVPCPDPNHESNEGATSLSECRCRTGFKTRQNTCQVLECPALTPPMRGSFVRDPCPRVFNAACGVACETGHRLFGSSIRLCLANGSWSGQPPQCTKRECPTLRAPRHGYARCDSSTETGNVTDARTVDTRCELGCDPGFVLLGSKTRTCLALGAWDGLPSTCKVVTCPPLPVPRQATVSPPSCSSGKQSHGQMCNVTCKLEGFVLRGSGKRECEASGKWSGGKPRCVDVQPPVIKCPADMTLETDLDEEFATINVSWPQIIDNSGGSVRVLVTPPLRLTGGRLTLGVTRVTLKATDLVGNFANCAFNITVLDRQLPTVDGCESPPPFLTDGVEATNVSWTEPTFSDNSGLSTEIWSTHRPGATFPLGSTEVLYTARDEAGNTANCSITVDVQALQCEEPLHGHAECSGPDSHCSLACDEGYAFALSPASDPTCDPTWDSPFPDCSVVSVPDTISQQLDVTEDIPRNMGDLQDCNDLSNDISAQLDLVVSAACGDELSCHVERFEDPCLERSADEQDASRDHGEETTNAVRTRRAAKNKRQPEYKLSSNGNSTSGYKFRLVGHLKVTGGGQDNLRASLGTVRALLSSGRHNSSQRLPAIRVRFDPSSESLGCPTGSVLRSGDICVQCPRGTFLVKGARECSVCSAGSFQSKPGQPACTQCPPGTSTRPGQLATKRQHCFALCRPGTWSRDGLVPCSLCPLATSQSSRGQTSCIPCPSKTTTHRRGADTERLCRAWCGIGTVSRTGLTPCTPCPPHYTQPSPGQRVCLHTCSKPPCRAPLPASHPCMLAPCHGLASCVPNKHSFTCLCPPGFAGTFCEVEVDLCESEPCANGANCTHNGANFTCTCTPGFSGPQCEEDEDECLSSPCLNLGACTDLPGAFSCECAPGFAGARCDEVSSACEALSPCLAGGMCEDAATPPGFTCHCPSSRGGERCERLLDPCEAAQCLHGATCVPEPWPKMDDGQLPSVTCVCPTYYSGQRCEIVGGPCASSPCLNGATCQPLTSPRGSFRCLCPDHLAGETCNITLQDDAVLRFPNSGTVDYVLREDALPRPLHELTVCLWLRTADTLNYGTPFSYATPQQDNTLAITDYSGFVVYVNGHRAVTDVSANDGAWHLVCLLWASQQGAWSLYKDGRQAEAGTGLANNTLIPVGGTLVLGQEQDSPGGSFSAAQSFLGRLGPTALWPSLLLPSQLAAMFEECGEGAGPLLLGKPGHLGHGHGTEGNVSLGNTPALWSWRDTLAGIRGKLQLEPSAFCAGCPPPLTPQHGLVNVSGAGAGAVASFSCLAGFRQAGARRSVCSKRGAWQPDSVQPPSCSRIVCGQPEAPAHGTVVAPSIEFGSSAHFSCHPGYTLEPLDAVRECQHTGEWSGQTPQCQEVTCRLTVSSVAHGSWHRFTSHEEDHNGTDESLASVGEQIEVECEPGFELQSAALMTCLDSGQWDHEPPACSAPCSAPPPAIPNSRPVLVSGSKARYSCLPGFTMQGSPLVTCSEVWEPLPECVAQSRQRCLPPPRISHGAVDTPEGVEAGNEAHYHCKPGYLIVGSETLTCEVDGTWRPEPPQCRASCNSPPPLENGHVTFEQGVGRYSCDPGYELTGTAELRCEGDAWSADSPVCALTGCPPPRDIEHATIKVRNDNYKKGGIVEYKCTRGFQLVGPRFRKCLGPEEQWSSLEPYCKPILA